MRRLSAFVALALASLITIPAVALNVQTGVAPPCKAGARYACTDLFIPSWDGTHLDASLYIPDSATSSSPAPVVLMTHGYGGWHRGSGDLNFQALFASDGYVVLGYTSRGFGRSEGTVQLQSPDWEVNDASHLISWLANPDNAGGTVLLDSPGNPRIGMAGGSYAGGIQLLTAGYDSRLDAITPQVTWNDLRYSLAPNGVTKHGWIDLLYASGKYSGYFGPIGGTPPVIGTDGVPADQDLQVATTYLTNENFELPPGVTYSDGSTSSYDYLSKRSPYTVVDNITAATLLIQGQQDTLFWGNEAIANMNSIADNAGGVPTKLVVFSAGHGWPDLAGERAAINDRIRTWFDRYLNANTSASTGPAIEWWQPWLSGSNFLSLSAVPGTTAVPLSQAEATLVNAVAPTSHSEVTNFQSNTSGPSFDAASGVTSADIGVAVPEGSAFVGIPELRFTLTTASTEAIVFAKLWDVDYSGNRKLIHHLVTPARIRGGLGDFCSSTVPAAFSASPAGTTAVCLPLAATAWRVEADHNLVLTLATSDSTHFGSRVPGVYEISGLELRLPIV